MTATKLTHSGSLVISAAPEDLYDMVADVTRMGEWSPICKSCWWDEGAGPQVGAWFTGRNELPERTWETRSEVVGACARLVDALSVHADLADDGEDQVLRRQVGRDLAVEGELHRRRHLRAVGLHVRTRGRRDEDHGVVAAASRWSDDVR